MKKMFIIFMLALLTISGSCFAGDQTKTTKPSTVIPAVKTDYTGHYKCITSSPGVSSVLDVERKSDTEIKFQGTASSREGQMCDVSGVAKLNKGVYEYKQLYEEGEGEGVRNHLKITAEGKNLKLEHIKGDVMGLNLDGKYKKESNKPKFVDFDE